MANEYAAQPAVFLEQPVDSPMGDRYDRWWAAYGSGSGSVYLPLVMVDSGNRISCGPVDFYNEYKSMINAEVARPPGAELEATFRIEANRMRFSARVKNDSGATLSFARNRATLHALVYEDARVGNTSRIVRAAISTPILSDLMDGGSATFAIDSPDLVGVNWDKLHGLILADYRPGGITGPYDMLQAALASPMGESKTLFFPQISVGQGWITAILLSNTGSDTVTTSLTFIEQDGNPFSLTLSEAIDRIQPVGREESPNAKTGTFALLIPPGATKIITASPLDSGDARKNGWARVDFAAGALDGVATFQNSDGTGIKTLVGVLASQATEFATIPVDSDDGQERYDGVALANPGDEAINIKLVALDENGAVAAVSSPPELNPLGPQKQLAKFLHELLPSKLKFRGSLVLLAEGGKKFSAVALVQNHRIFSAIPVILSKPPTVTY